MDLIEHRGPDGSREVGHSHNADRQPTTICNVLSQVTRHVFVYQGHLTLTFNEDDTSAGQRR